MANDRKRWRWQGAQVIYKGAVEPLLTKYESKIDSHIENLKSGASAVARDAQENLGADAAKLANKAIGSAVAYKLQQDASS